MEDTLKILETVNQFYTSSFNQLVILTVAVLSFAGIVVPILITLYQKRLFKLENIEIKELLKKELKLELKEAILEIKSQYEEKDEKYQEKIDELDIKLEKEISGAIGGNMHIQGNMQIKNKAYLNALNSFCKASIQHIKADKETNLRRALSLIENKCLPNLSKKTLEADENNIECFEDLLNQLEDYDTNDRYTDNIRMLKIRYKQAIEREIAPKA